jgi:hypothetical protein
MPKIRKLKADVSYRVIRSDDGVTVILKNLKTGKNIRVAKSTYKLLLDRGMVEAS